MITPNEYRTQNQALMEEYETRVRDWLREKGEKGLAEKIPFFRDGVTCPEQWFREENNDFRPLFILKEVSIGKNDVNEVDDYLMHWGNPKHIDFAENPFEDIRNGAWRTWQNVARLAKGLEDAQKQKDNLGKDYLKIDFSYQEGGDLYSGDIEGYKDKPYNSHRTANRDYIAIIDRIAVINIKKVGGGTMVSSELSKATGYYTEHVEPFQDLLIRQINLISPTVIVCLGKESGNWVSECAWLDAIKKGVNNKKVPWIGGYHPAAPFVSNKAKCEYTISMLHHNY